jgi:single-strand DNA-binding protein
MGRLVHDPKVSYTQTTNKMVVTFRLAVNRRMQEGTDFFNIVAWNKTGEFISKYFKKGQQILLNGRLQNRDYEGKDNKKVYVTEIIAEEVYFADSKKNGEQVSEQVQNEFTPSFSMLDDDDDLPF